METLVCTLCVTEKPVSEFYKNKVMPSGYANQCKECVKARSKKREKLLRKDPDWVEKERLRAVDKYHRLNYKDKQEELNKNKPWKKNSLYKNLYRNLFNKGLISESESIHHWNYNLIEDYFILQKELHRKIHTQLVFDDNSLCFFNKNTNELIDTRIKHENFIAEFKCDY